MNPVVQTETRIRRGNSDWKRTKAMGGLGSTVSRWLLFFFCVLLGKNHALVDQLFWPQTRLNPASNQAKTIEKHLRDMSRDCSLLYVRTFPWSYRVSSENGCKTVLMRIVNRINPSQLRLKRLIPVKLSLLFLVRNHSREIQMTISWRPRWMIGT